MWSLFCVFLVLSFVLWPCKDAGSVFTFGAELARWGRDFFLHFFSLETLAVHSSLEAQWTRTSRCSVSAWLECWSPGCGLGTVHRGHVWFPSRGLWVSWVLSSGFSVGRAQGRFIGRNFLEALWPLGPSLSLSLREGRMPLSHLTGCSDRGPARLVGLFGTGFQAISCPCTARSTGSQGVMVMAQQLGLDMNSGFTAWPPSVQVWHRLICP